VMCGERPDILPWRKEYSRKISEIAKNLKRQSL